MLFAVVIVIMFVFPPMRKNIFNVDEDMHLQVVQVDGGFNFIGSIGSTDGKSNRFTHSVNVEQLLLQVFGAILVFGSIYIIQKKSDNK